MTASLNRAARARRALAACALACASLAAPAEPSLLTEPRVAQFDSLDPPRAFDQDTDQVVRQVYSTLLTYAYLERPYRLEPDLLEGMPVLAADKVTWTFRLRPGVRFVDNACFPGGKGRELTSDDVLYSLKRFADARLNVQSWFTMAGAVVGLDDYRAATAKAAAGVDLTNTEVAGLHKVDAHSFTIRLTHENALFLYALTTAPSAIVAPEAVRFYKDRFGVNPVGTGPFILPKEAERKGTLHFVRNPGYYRTYPSVGAPGDAEQGLLRDAGKRLPLVDELDMPLIEEAQPAALKFLRGEIDWRALDRANFTKLVQRTPEGGFRLGDEYASRFKLYWAPGLNTSYLLVNLRDPVLGRNRALRQALATAIDPKAISDVVYNGRTHALQSLVPWELPGNERETGARYYVHDVAAARKLLADAGYPGGQGLAPITVSFAAGDADFRNLFDLLKAQCAAIGVQLKPVFMDNPTFTKANEGGNFQLSLYSWVADYPDAEDFYQLMYGKNTAPGSNWSMFVNPAYDQAYEASRFMANGPQRLAYFRTMNTLIKDEVPLIILYDITRVGILQNWVGNFKRNLLLQEHMYLSVDMAAKKKGIRP